jgi:hypothetical protein
MSIEARAPSGDAPIVEFMGLTREAASLVESFRESPNETRVEIIVRVLQGHRGHEVEKIGLDLGQGAIRPVQGGVAERPDRSNPRRPSRARRQAHR